MNEKNYENLSFLDLVCLAKQTDNKKEKKLLFELANKALAKSFEKYKDENNN